MEGFKPSTTVPPQKIHGLFEIIRAFKSFSARKINKLHLKNAKNLWQRSYYERIIRNEFDFNRICEYIINNPLKWEVDEYNK